VITAPVAAAATGRAKSAIHQAISELEEAGVLEPLSDARRNRSWEAVGLLDLLTALERGDHPESDRPSLADPWPPGRYPMRWRP
jgi:predicted transcriptional regulator